MSGADTLARLTNIMNIHLNVDLSPMSEFFPFTMSLKFSRDFAL